MRVIAKRTLRELSRHHADAKGALEAWYREVKRASWGTPGEALQMKELVEYAAAIQRCVESEPETGT